MKQPGAYLNRVTREYARIGDNVHAFKTGDQSADFLESTLDLSEFTSKNRDHKTREIQR